MARKQKEWPKNKKRMLRRLASGVFFEHLSEEAPQRVGQVPGHEHRQQSLGFLFGGRGVKEVSRVDALGSFGEVRFGGLGSFVKDFGRFWEGCRVFLVCFKVFGRFLEVCLVVLEVVLGFWKVLGWCLAGCPPKHLLDLFWSLHFYRF